MAGNLKDQIYKELEKRIIDMVYQPGDAINEKALAEEFGVSRTPIREVILQLSQKGFLDMIPRVGTFVTQIDLGQVKHAYEVKLSLEGLASELAATRASADQIDELFEIVERFRGYDLIRDYSKVIKDDQRFHQIVREASGNPILVEMLASLNIKTARFLQHIKYTIEDAEWFGRSLQEMAEAMRDRDGSRAKAATEEHTRILIEQMSAKFFYSK